MAPQGYMPELFGNSKGDTTLFVNSKAKIERLPNIDIQYLYFMPIFLRFKEELKQKLIKKNINGHFLYEYPINAKEFTDAFKKFVNYDKLSTYSNNTEDMPITNSLFVQKIDDMKKKIEDIKKDILIKKYFIRENVLRYWFEYHHKINEDPLIYLDKLKNFLKKFFVDYCNGKEDLKYDTYIEFYKYMTFENSEIIYNLPGKMNYVHITQNYDLLIDILNDLYCVIICYYIDNEKKISEFIISANKLFHRLYSIMINDKSFCKNIGMINKFRNFGSKFFQRTNGGKKIKKPTKPKINKVTKPKVKKVTKPKDKKPTKPKVKKSTKSKVIKVTKPNLKKSTKLKVKKPIK